MTAALQCTNVANRSGLVLTVLHSEFVGGTTEYVNAFFFDPKLNAGRLSRAALYCSVRFMTAYMSQNTREVLGNVSELTIPLVLCFGRDCSPFSFGMA